MGAMEAGWARARLFSAQMKMSSEREETRRRRVGGHDRSITERERAVRCRGEVRRSRRFPRYCVYGAVCRGAMRMSEWKFWTGRLRRKSHLFATHAVDHWYLSCTQYDRACRGPYSTPPAPRGRVAIAELRRACASPKRVSHAGIMRAIVEVPRTGSRRFYLSWLSGGSDCLLPFQCLLHPRWHLRRRLVASLFTFARVAGDG